VRAEHDRDAHITSMTATRERRFHLPVPCQVFGGYEGDYSRFGPPLAYKDSAPNPWYMTRLMETM